MISSINVMTVLIIPSKMKECKKSPDHKKDKIKELTERVSIILTGMKKKLKNLSFF